MIILQIYKEALQYNTWKVWKLHTSAFCNCCCCCCQSGSWLSSAALNLYCFKMSCNHENFAEIFISSKFCMSQNTYYQLCSVKIMQCLSQSSFKKKYSKLLNNRGSPSPIHATSGISRTPKICSGSGFWKP